MENMKIYGFDIVPGCQGSELAYQVSLEQAIAEVKSHRGILEEDPELAYMLPFPPSDIYEITLWPPTTEILVTALNDPSRLAVLLEMSRETVLKVGSAVAGQFFRHSDTLHEQLVAFPEVGCILRPDIMFCPDHMRCCKCLSSINKASGVAVGASKCAGKIIIAAALATTAAAADFKSYENGRFGFSIGLPGQFCTVLIPENGDGMGLESAAKLSVWGNILTEGGFKAESDHRLKLQADEGWNFTQEKRGTSWASF